MLSRVAAADEVHSLLYTGKVRLHSIHVKQWTFDAPALYLQVYNHASPTVGTTAPVCVIQVPAGRADFQAVSQKVQFSGNNGGMYLDTGLSYAVTTTHDGSTAMDAGDEPEVIVDFEPV